MQEPDSQQTDPAPATLLIAGRDGSFGHLDPSGTRHDGGPAIRCGFGALSADLLASLSPGMVISALAGPGFDALEVAQRLVGLGYRGIYRVVGPGLSDPEMVRAEIADAAPDLDVGLICEAA